MKNFSLYPFSDVGLSLLNQVEFELLSFSHPILRLSRAHLDWKLSLIALNSSCSLKLSCLWLFWRSLLLRMRISRCNFLSLADLLLKTANRISVVSIGTVLCLLCRLTHSLHISDDYTNAVDNRTTFPLDNGFISLNSEHPKWTGNYVLPLLNHSSLKLISS